MDIHFVSLQRWSKAATSADDNLDISRLIHVHIPVVRQQLMFVWQHETGSIVNSLLIRMCPIFIVHKRKLCACSMNSKIFLNSCNALFSIIFEIRFLLKWHPISQNGINILESYLSRCNMQESLGKYQFYETVVIFVLIF